MGNTSCVARRGGGAGNSVHPAVRKSPEVNCSPPSLTFIFKVKSRSVVSDSLWTLYSPGTVAHQASLSMEFSKQEPWSGLPFPSPENLPNPGIEAGSPTLQTDSLIAEPPGKEHKHM